MSVHAEDLIILISNHFCLYGQTGWALDKAFAGKEDRRAGVGRGGAVPGLRAVASACALESERSGSLTQAASSPSN